MPMYEYLCQTGGHRFEALQRMTDDPLTSCQECGGSVRRVIQPVGIIFKGSGFYATDSRKASSASTNGSADSAKSDKAETKSESKTDSSASSGSSSSKSDSAAATPAAS